MVGHTQNSNPGYPTVLELKEFFFFNVFCMFFKFSGMSIYFLIMEMQKKIVFRGTLGLRLLSNSPLP